MPFIPCEPRPVDRRDVDRTIQISTNPQLNPGFKFKVEWVGMWRWPDDHISHSFTGEQLEPPDMRGPGQCLLTVSMWLVTGTYSD